MRCEALCGRSVEVVRENEQPGQPYRLCIPCAERLESQSLRPVEWFNLASVHSPWKFDLHDDFYSPSGEAEEPEVAVLPEPGLMRAPTLRDCATEPRRLLGYAFTRHFLEPETRDAFRRLDPVALLAALDGCLDGRSPNPRNAAMACAVAAETLGPPAAGFVRRALATFDADTYPGVVHAAAACLPREAALAWALGFIDGLDPAMRLALKDSLAAFADARVLDWIERHAAEIEVAASWQGLAAFSAFSWPRARAWLRSGRPLSLVALGALREGFGLNRLRAPNGDPPAPVVFPANDEIFTEFDAYLERDRSPNARDQIADLRAVLSRR